MKKLLHYKIAVLAAAVFLIILAIAGCTKNEKVSKTSLKLDTVVTITLYGNYDPEYIDSAFGEIDRLSALLDVNDEGSELYRLSENAGEWIDISPETAEVIALALEYYDLSNGYFDVTAAPLVELWNVNGGGYFPTEAEISSAAALVDGSQLQLDNCKARLGRLGMKADLGGIAKGFIADKVKEHLVGLGVERAVIDLGGNVVLIGAKPDGSMYNVGVKNPLDKEGELLATISGSDESMVTSGIYERYFEHNGKRYHHIIDPFTGAPSESDLAGVTIVSRNSAQADALSTACLLLGSDAALELIEKIDGVEALLVTRDGNVYKSSGMTAIIK